MGVIAMKTRVGVFFGGKSVEHEVSVISGMQALAALDTEKYQPVPVYVTKENDFYTGAALSEIESYRDIPAMLACATQVDFQRRGPDAVMLRRKRLKFGDNTVGVIDVALPVFHGTGGEDGIMQAMFELLELPYAGCDVTASGSGMDKWVTKALFAQAGVPCLPAVKVAKAAFFASPQDVIAEVTEKLGLPVVVKPHNTGSSVGISLARDAETLYASIEDALAYSMFAICESAVEPLREINCSVLGDSEHAEASVCEEPARHGELLSFEDKYKGGGKGAKDSAAKGSGMSSLSRRIPADIPGELTEQVRVLAVKAFQAIDAAGVARIDFLLNAETMQLWVNEINTIPGSLAFYLWQHTGLSFSALLDRMISLALKRKREKSRLSFTFEGNLLSSASLPRGKAGKL